MLINQWKTVYRNLDKALLFWRKQVFCLENWKLWQAPTTIDSDNFCWSFAHVSYLPVSTKGCSGFFLFCLELELFAKIKKDLVSTHSQKPGLSITQDLSKIKKKKNPKHAFVVIGKTETCAKFHQKILNAMVVGARQSFQFLRQITLFLGNKRALFSFKYWILYQLISIIKLQNN